HPFLMPVVADAKSGVIKENDLHEVIRIIETYLFRRVTCGVAANAVNKIMATAYTEMRKLRTDNQSYASLLTYLLRRRDGEIGRFPTDSEFSERLATRVSYQLRPSSRRSL